MTNLIPLINLTSVSNFQQVMLTDYQGYTSNTSYSIQPTSSYAYFTIKFESNNIQITIYKFNSDNAHATYNLDTECYAYRTSSTYLDRTRISDASTTLFNLGSFSDTLNNITTKGGKMKYIIPYTSFDFTEFNYCWNTLKEAYKKIEPPSTYFTPVTQ